MSDIPRPPLNRNLLLVVAAVLIVCLVMAAIGLAGYLFFKGKASATEAPVTVTPSAIPSPSATGTLPADAIYTAAALTVTALQGTPPAPDGTAASLLQAKIGTLNPTFSATESPPCLRVEFVEDVSVPDGAQFQPGESFEKTWRFRNSGACAWTPDYTLAFFGGDQMGAPLAVALPQDVAPGQTVDISAPMVAPSEPGVYEGDWIFSEPAMRETFGFGVTLKGPVWVRIEVVSP